MTEMHHEALPNVRPHLKTELLPIAFKIAAFKDGDR